MSNRTRTQTASKIDEVAELRKQMEELKKQIQFQSSTQQQSIDVSEEELDKLRPDTYIQVMSLIKYRLTLSTQPMGTGKVFNFDRFGEVKRIPYSHVADIIDNHPGFLEAGYFYIMNPLVIRKHGLDDIYEKIMTKEKLEMILDAQEDTAITFYSQLNPRQRENINRMLVEKLKSGEGADMNIIYQIGKIGKVDLAKLAEEQKEQPEEE